jgi:hypothetical protein
MDRINPEIDDALNSFSGVSDEDKELVRNFLGYELQNNTGGGSSVMVQDAIQRRIDEVVKDDKK